MRLEIDTVVSDGDADPSSGSATEAGTVTVETTGTSAGEARPARGDVGGGFGLDGLRTRVAAVGGSLESGPTPNGWLLRARLPWAEVGR